MISILSGSEWVKPLTPIPQNDQTHSNNFSPTADQLFECVWPFCGIGT